MAGEEATRPLIRTRLYRPRVTEDLVPRPWRLERQRDRVLTCVVAPAGCGQTTLVTCWLAICDWPSGWLALDEGDSDLALFLSYFLAAIQTLFPDSVGQTLAFLRSDLPLSLPRPRERGQATEIRAHRLRFTEAETAAFLQQEEILVVPRTRLTAGMVQVRKNAPSDQESTNQYEPAPHPESWPGRVGTRKRRQLRSRDWYSRPGISGDRRQLEE